MASDDLILTEQEMLGYLNISNISDAELANYMLYNRAVQAEMERITGRHFCSQVINEKYDGDDTSKLYLSTWPVSSVSSFTVSGADVTGYEIDYDRGIIYLNSGTFPCGCRNISITYTGGYLQATDTHDNASVLPPNLKALVASLIVQAKRVAGRDFSKQSETLGNYNYTNAAVSQVIAAKSTQMNQWARGFC